MSEPRRIPQGPRLTPQLQHLFQSKNFKDPEGVEDDVLDRAWDRRRRDLRPGY